MFFHFETLHNTHMRTDPPTHPKRLTAGAIGRIPCQDRRLAGGTARHSADALRGYPLSDRCWVGGDCVHAETEAQAAPMTTLRASFPVSPPACINSVAPSRLFGTRTFSVDRRPSGRQKSECSQSAKKPRQRAGRFPLVSQGASDSGYWPPPAPNSG
jgi:hypothetical protein